MKTTAILTTALCCAMGLCPLQAQETAIAAGQAETQAWATPAYDTGLYPAWSQMTPEGMVADIRAGIAIAHARIEAVCAIEPGQETYENVFAALETYADEMRRVRRYMNTLSATMNTPALRQASEDLIPDFSALSAEFTNNPRLWAVVERAAAQPWVKELSPAKQRFVQQTVEAFQDSGVRLPAEKRARLLEIGEELTRLQHKFSQNVLDSSNATYVLVTDAAQLAGMPPEWMKTAEAAARQRGLGTPEKPAWLITKDAPSRGRLLTRCKVEATRKLCWETFDTVGRTGAFDNSAIIPSILELRAEYARILGFKDYADMVCKDRMVGCGGNALAFVDGMMQDIRPAYEKENRELMEFISLRTGRKVEALNPWDVPFYMDQLYQERYNTDQERIRPYFRSDNVLRGMFGAASRLYGITITELPAVHLQPGEPCPEGKVEVWHPDVQVFKITDDKTGDHLGTFYYDPYPRPSKRAGAWMNTIRPGQPAKDGRPHTPHLAAIVANLSRPTGDGYALYSTSDVTTVFHEFGHMLHCMLSDTELRSHSCTAVERDFVELPSQINENWVWEPECLATFALHHETGEPMPPKLMANFIASRFFMPATRDMGQLRYAKLDLEVHMHYAEKFAGRSLDEASDELLAPWRAPYTVEIHSPLYTFSHIMTNGYSAGYFCYMWADVLVADAFSRFQKEGVMNPETGAAFRNTILKQGDSKPAAELFRDFMGRDPNPDALLEKHGFKPAPEE